MILTGKCKEGFTIWMKKYPNIRPQQFEKMPEWMINALIIDFFDSVGITIMILPYSTRFELGDDLIGMDGTWSFFIYIKENHKKNGVDFESRAQATTGAIKKANEIFNTL